MSVVHASTTSTTFSTGIPGRRPSLTGATAASELVRQLPVVTLVRAEAARLLGRHQRAHQGRGHPGVGPDGVLGRLVARDGVPKISPHW